MTRRPPTLDEGFECLRPVAPPKILRAKTAATLRRPRRCNVPWHRRGGTLTCDLCANQKFGRITVHCLATEDPPLFRPRRDKDDTT
jgi:hypothetical protein